MRHQTQPEHRNGQGSVTGLPTPRSILPKKILSSKSVLEGERKQVTVLFADLKSSMELLADRDPEEARRILDPVLKRMMEAVHRYVSEFGRRVQLDGQDARARETIERALEISRNAGYRALEARALYFRARSLRAVQNPLPRSRRIKLLSQSLSNSACARLLPTATSEWVSRINEWAVSGGQGGVFASNRVVPEDGHPVLLEKAEVELQAIH